MNDKIQLAAMGEHMASMKLTIHGHGINSEEEASGGFLTRCLPCSSRQQQTPCMAKRIEELEGLLTEAAQYIHDYCEVTSSQGYSRGIRLLNCIRQQVYAPKPDTDK